MKKKAVLKEKRKAKKVTFLNAIFLLRKSMSDFKKERKSEWKIFKSQFKKDLVLIEKTLKTSKALHEKL